MPKVLADADNLNERNAEFEHRPLTEPVFLNSVPKCGTHLMRNIMRMFVRLDQQHQHVFIQHPVLRQNAGAYDPRLPKLSWGHLLFSDEAAIMLRQTNHVVLVRDPYDWVLARARFFLSDTFQGSLEHLKGGAVSTQTVLNMMIFGIHERAPAMYEIFLHNAVSWIGTEAHIVKFEDLLAAVLDLESLAAERFFSELFVACRLGDLPDDWRERVRIGSDRTQSGTARENLKGPASDIPEVLPDVQKELVDFAAPGLRRILGYE